MPKRMTESDAIEEIEAFKKSDLAHRKIIAKRIDHLDARYNALPAAEKAIGGNITGSKSRRK